jgi:hypothetical protein
MVVIVIMRGCTFSHWQQFTREIQAVDDSSPEVIKKKAGLRFIVKLAGGNPGASRISAIVISRSARATYPALSCGQVDSLANFRISDRS